MKQLVGDLNYEVTVGQFGIDDRNLLGQLLILIPTYKFILLAYWPIRFTKSEHKTTPKVRAQILSGSPVQFTKSQP
jgi:hypothetical protein